MHPFSKKGGREVTRKKGEAVACKFLTEEKQEFPVQSQMQVQLLWVSIKESLSESSCAYTHPENISTIFLSITIIIIYVALDEDFFFNVEIPKL